MSNTKISVYSQPDLKNTTDDALPNYLNSLKFQQSHVLTDIRLGLGYAAVVIAAATFYLDYKFGWEKTKDYTLWAVVVYFALNSALTLWIWAVEKGKIYSGSSGDVLITIASSVTKHYPSYKLKIRQTKPSKGDSLDWDEMDIEAPFTKWFTSDGQFVAKPFQQWLSSEIPLIREAAAK
ncbi:hypothetical protein MMC10_010811 [Thelotrema lepadinum]|nr:hypothetical protein [Thelotrema lepadinum]